VDADSNYTLNVTTDTFDGMPRHTWGNNELENATNKKLIVLCQICTKDSSYTFAIDSITPIENFQIFDRVLLGQKDPNANRSEILIPLGQYTKEETDTLFGTRFKRDSRVM